MDSISITGYASREAALKSLRQYTDARQDKNPEDFVSEAERVLLDSLIYIERSRARLRVENSKMREEDDIASRDMEKISWALGFQPIPDWYRNFHAMRIKMGVPVAVPFIDTDYGPDGKKRRKYHLRDHRPEEILDTWEIK